MPPIVVFDLDGTLALIEHRLHFLERSPKQWRAFYAACSRDVVHEPVAAVFRALRLAGHEIWIVTGRSDEVRGDTVAWLTAHELQPDKLLMRSAEDRQRDDTLKRSWLRSGVIPKKRVLCVFEDRTRVVEMWRKEGVVCLQVRAGDF